MGLRASIVRLAGLLAVVVAGGGVAVATPEKTEALGPHVLLITVDTLRADHVSMAGYARETTPHLDAFFREGEVYLRAYSAEANTGPSIVSLLTGMYPPRHGVRLLYQKIDDAIPTLADHLGRRGHQTAAVVSNVVLTGDAIGLDRRFDHYDDHLDEQTNREDVFERRADATTDAALRWLEQDRDRNRPHFLWVHYIDPHGPYDPPPNRPKDFSHDAPAPLGGGRIQAYQRLEGVDDGLEYRDRYDEEIAFMDEQVGRLLRRYEELGLADEATVVFTADHGETMTEHDRYFTHGYHVWEPIMRVPLAIRRAGGRAQRIETPVSLVDLVPTLLADLRIVAPSGLDGRPLAERTPGSPIFLEASGDGTRQQAVVAQGRKWFATVDANGTTTDRWTLDPAARPERRGTAPWQDGQPGNALMARIGVDASARVRTVREPAPTERGGPKVAAGRTDFQIRALRALGYVE